MGVLTFISIPKPSLQLQIGQLLHPKSHLSCSIQSPLEITPLWDFQNDNTCFLQDISQENNNILESLEQSHLFAEVTPKQLGTLQP